VVLICYVTGKLLNKELPITRCNYAFCRAYLHNNLNGLNPMKLMFFFLLIMEIFISCKYKKQDNNSNTDSTSNRPVENVEVPKKQLHGTWISTSSKGSMLLDIEDTNRVFYYGFSKNADTSFFLNKGHHLVLYKSPGSMGYWNDSFIWVKLRDVRLDYKIRGDSLIEVDKMGEQAILVRAYTDEEKYYRLFDTSRIIGELTYVNKVDERELFIIKGNDIEYQVTSLRSNSNNNKFFSEVASVGDSIYKLPGQTSFTVVKKDTKSRIHFGFVKRL